MTSTAPREPLAVWFTVLLRWPPDHGVRYLGDLVFGLLQFVRLVGPQQLGLGLPLLLQRALSILPSLPRPHALVKTPLWTPDTRQTEKPELRDDSAARHCVASDKMQDSNSSFVRGRLRARRPAGGCSRTAALRRQRSRWRPAPDAAAPSFPPPPPAGTGPVTGPCCPRSCPTWPCFWRTPPCTHTALGNRRRIQSTGFALKDHGSCAPIVRFPQQQQKEMCSSPFLWLTRESTTA